MRKPRLGTVLLTLWGIILTASVYAYLAWLQPSRLGTTVSSVLENAFDVRCSMRAVSLSFLPLPSLTIDDLSLHRGSVEHLEFHARRVSAEISWFSLLRLKPIVRSFSMESPTLDISGRIFRQNSGSPQGRPLESQGFTLPPLPRYITGVPISLTDGMCRFSSPDGKDSLTLTGIDLDAELPGLTPGSLDLSVDSIRYLLASGIDLSARQTRIRLDELSETLNGRWEGSLHATSAFQLGALDSVMGRRISDPYRYFPMPEPLRLALTSRFSASPGSGEVQADGRFRASALLTMNGHDVPIWMDIPFALDDLDSGLAVRQADLRMEDDRLVIDGLISGLRAGRPKLVGRAEICHFSLTRWFGFGRLMDPGLQHALDNITGEFEEFELTPYGVVVPRLRAEVEGIRLSGSGSCKEFLKPDIRIDAHARSADLNRVFTELHNEFPDLSHLPPPVLPMPAGKALPEKSSDESGIHVGYDIHISADDARIMNFRVGGADVHVIPAPKKGTMLTIDVANVYGGKADSKVYIQDDIRVVADLDGVALSGPSAALAGYSVLSGKLKKGHVDIRFQPGNGVRMLTTLGGSVKASMEQGRISVKGSAPVPYQTFLVDAQASAASGKGARKMPSSVDFLGRWDVSLDSKQWSVQAASPRAVLAFSTSYGLPCEIREQPMDIDLILKKTLSPHLGQDLPLSVSGKVSFNAAKGTLGLSAASLRHHAFSGNGSLRLTDIFKAPAANGRAALHTADLRQVLDLFGCELPSPAGQAVFLNSRAEADFALSQGQLALNGLSGLVDQTGIKGDVVWNWKKRHSLTGNLDLTSLDLDDYLPKNGEDENDRGEPLPLPLDFLRDTDIRASVTLRSLRALKTTLRQTAFTVIQKDGRLSVPLSAVFPGGGQVSSLFSAELSPQAEEARMALQLRANAVDMLALCRDRGQKTLISGTGSVQAALTSTQRFWNDWKHTLGGSFSALVTNGAFITPGTFPDDSGKVTEKRTSFKALSLSGLAEHGIVSCQDFRVTDTLLNVEGGGTVDLSDQTIDARATITVAGIPELPLTITGSLFEPKTNYQLIGAVTGTVGNIGSTVFDILGSVISAPLKLLTGGRPLLPR